jgi:hypothetical protein
MLLVRLVAVFILPLIKYGKPSSLSLFLALVFLFRVVVAWSATSICVNFLIDGWICYREMRGIVGG